MSKEPMRYGLSPINYTAAYTTIKPELTGKADCRVWKTAAKLPRFVDMLDGSPALLDTHASIVWDEEAMYIAFWANEPNLRSTLDKRDDLLFFENNLEIFIDGIDTYYELQFNPLGNIYEVFFIWRDKFLQKTWDKNKFDLNKATTHSFCGDYPKNKTNFWTGNHPRGSRWAFLDYDLNGLQVFTHYEGTLNDPSTVDKQWSAEIKIPWSSLNDLANGRTLPPNENTSLGLFLGRFEKLTGLNGEEFTVGWTTHPIGVADPHIPESFLQVTFRK